MRRVAVSIAQKNSTKLHRADLPRPRSLLRRNGEWRAWFREWAGDEECCSIDSSAPPNAGVRAIAARVGDTIIRSDQRWRPATRARSSHRGRESEEPQ